MGQLHERQGTQRAMVRPERGPERPRGARDSIEFQQTVQCDFQQGV